MSCREVLAPPRSARQVRPRSQRGPMAVTCTSPPGPDGVGIACQHAIGRVQSRAESDDVGSLDCGARQPVRLPAARVLSAQSDAAWDSLLVDEDAKFYHGHDEQLGLMSRRIVEPAVRRWPEERVVIVGEDPAAQSSSAIGF